VDINGNDKLSLSKQTSVFYNFLDSHSQPLIVFPNLSIAVIRGVHSFT
jgi:hypothetical protein